MSVPASQQVLNFKDLAGTWRSIKCNLTGITYTKAVSVEKVETLCGVTKTPTLPDNKLAMNGLFEDNSDGTDITSLHKVIVQLQDAQHRTEFQYGPNGDASNNTLVSGFGYFTNYEVNGQAGASLLMTGEFEIDGNAADTFWP